MFLAYKKGLKLDGTNPTLLYGYGGLQHRADTGVLDFQAAWMEMAACTLRRNIRGGGEYGKDWHQAAVKTKRQVAYDDFIAATEWLIAKKYTQTKKLAIHGGSTAACSLAPA